MLQVTSNTFLSNVDGATGTKIINRMIEGETDIDELMQYYHGKIKVSRQEFRLALEGHLTTHHRLMLQIYKASIADKERQIKRLDAEIEKATAAYQVEVELLQTIPGVGKDSAISIISETGVDMEQFPDEHHMSNWSGMSPGNNETGGKKNCKNSQRQCTSSKHISGMCMGRHPKKGRFSKTQI